LGVSRVDGRLRKTRDGGNMEKKKKVGGNIKKKKKELEKIWE